MFSHVCFVQDHARSTHPVSVERFSRSVDMDMLVAHGMNTDALDCLICLICMPCVCVNCCLQYLCVCVCVCVCVGVCVFQTGDEAARDKNKGAQSFEL